MNFEYIMWITTRISGLALILLAIVGVVGAFYLGARLQVDMPTLMRWTFFPNSWHVANSEVIDPELRWSNVFWQLIQTLILFFGLTHGFNGLRVVLEDYIGRSFLRPFLRGLVFLLWLAWLVVAAYIIWVDTAF